MIKFLIAIVLLVPFFCSANTLLNNFQRAKVGDYMVTTQSRNCTFLVIHYKDENCVGIEEITVPSKRMSQLRTTWKNWFKNGAKFNTNHISYKINLQTGKMYDCYSMTQQKWVSIPSHEQFLPTLLNLQLMPVSANERRRIGLMPPSSVADQRPFWQPKLTIDGQEITGVTFAALRAQWPNDGSQLSAKTIDIYIPENNEKYPSYFPYWIQAQGTALKATVYVIDSGSGLL